jgi:phage baseplate assembly protein W
MTTVLGTGLAFPLGVDDRGRIALARGEIDVEQAIRIILSTAPGERPMRPEFGCAVHDCVFERIEADTLARIDQAVRVALDRWEPRIAIEDIAFESRREGELLVHLRYRLRATNDVRNLVFPFYVVPAEEAS